ncbi:MAG: single-stranded DNA-binding protein [Candidatus Omnitrophica bacterium]|nr:single-stranded DNA-binding protein [Candidatus Omnitrophota bacterium]MCB9747605.1 single-stranded DNA-binding protein [Candidatus Omnitrophota bacterium]
MANLNKVFLIGNLTRDPELRYTPGGTAVANLGIAVNRRFKDSSGELKEEVCFLTVTVWDKQAEACCQYLTKGRSVFVEGVLQSRFWETNDGQKRSAIDVRAERVQFLGSYQNSGKDKNEAKSEEGLEMADISATQSETIKPEDIAWDE